MNIISCGGEVLGGAEFAGFIGWGFEVFLFCVLINCFAARLRRDRVSVADIDFFSFALRELTFFTRGKSKQKHGAVLIGEITITKRSHRPVKRFVGTLL